MWLGSTSTAHFFGLTLLMGGCKTSVGSDGPPEVIQLYPHLACYINYTRYRYACFMVVLWNKTVEIPWYNFFICDSISLMYNLPICIHNHKFYSHFNYMYVECTDAWFFLIYVPWSMVGSFRFNSTFPNMAYKHATSNSPNSPISMQQAIYTLVKFC